MFTMSNGEVNGKQGYSDERRTLRGGVLSV